MDGLRIARDAQNGLDRANAQLREALEQERRRAEEKLLLLTSAREAMSLEFKTLAEDIMARHGDSFSKLNKEQIEGILTPLREKIVEFEQKVHASTLESATGRTALSEQIRFIGEMGAVMGRETKELTEALRGKSQTQGAWGEMVLNTILEGSGLRPDVEYTSQKSVTNAEGRRLRPDVIVRLPGSQHIVVDAKVSLAAFEALCSATEEEDRSEHLAQHLASVRSHILQLGSKEYHAATGGTLDYVLMFVPIEGALAAALNAEPELVAFAIERGVALTSPTTLMIALRTVANVWRVERRNHNAEEIAERAGRLYDKFVGFVADIQALGASMQRTRQSYDAAMGKLVTGKGNVVWQAETLREMGARAAKTLPAELIAAAEASVPVSLPTDGPGLETELQAERMPDGTMARPDQTGVLAGELMTRVFLSLVLVLALQAIVLPQDGAAAAITKRVHSDRTGEDFLVSCDAGPIDADYVAETSSGVKLTDPYAVARGADKGLVMIMSQGGKRAKRYIIPHRLISAIVRIQYDQDLLDRVDLVFTTGAVMLIHTSTANAGIFTISGVYEMPYGHSGKLDRKTLQGQQDLPQILDLGLSLYQPAKAECGS